MNREQARETAKAKLSDYLESKGINTRKPFTCLNPAHPDKHPSMSFDAKRNRCKCFSCGATYDIFDIIGIEYNLTDPAEKFNKTYSILGIMPDTSRPTGSGSQDADPGPKEPAERESGKTSAKYLDFFDAKYEDFSEYFRKTQEAITEPAARQYLTSRGISQETAALFGLGYDSRYKTADYTADGKKVFTEWKALIIPTSHESYVARNIDKPKSPENKNRYRKKGPSIIFNSKALYSSTRPVFVVEGEIDALSIIEAGGEAIGLGSTGNYKQLVKLLTNQPPAQPLILSLDADERGRKAESELAEELKNLNINYYRYSPYIGAKDANEALTTDRKQFAEELKNAERLPEDERKAQAEAEREAYFNTSAAAHIKDFWNGIKENADTPAISTGFNNLDKILDGGLYEGLYFLGAMSSLGKTTLLLQIADNIASQGQDVIFFSLEMARSELMAKSISRWTFMLCSDPADAKTTRGITNGARYADYNQHVLNLINEATKKYRTYADHLFIHEGIGNIGIDTIRKTVEKHITITGRKPVVMIDYLQILAPSDTRSTDKQNTDRAVSELKRISRDYKIPVVGISSFNRDSYRAGGGANKGRVSMTDFKESGAVEYSSDVLIGLEFFYSGTNDYSEREEKQRDPRQIRLVVMKNRNGQAWTDTGFEYYPMFNYYEEAFI